LILSKYHDLLSLKKSRRLKEKILSVAHAQKIATAMACES